MARLTVREASYEVLRDCALTTIFGNPGSTEIPFLADLPDDLEFVLGLHESTVVGMASGYALGHERPALALLHTTAGLGNAVGAIATARVNRAPLVIVVGQQDRRHLALEPFLAGRLAGLAGEYPLEVIQPVIAQDVPSAIRRAWHCAADDRGPVLVVVPMDDWLAPHEPSADAAARRVVTAPRGVPAAVGEVCDAISRAHRIDLVAGAGTDHVEGWRAVRQLADHLDAGVWIEPFGARAGFHRPHPRSLGQLPADRTGLRAALAHTDLLLVIGTAALRQYAYDAGPLLPESTSCVVITDDPAEARRSAVPLALVGDIPAIVHAVRDGTPARVGQRLPTTPVARPAPPGPADPLRPADVFHLLAEHLGDDAIVVEESPSSRPALQEIVPVGRPLGFLSAAMGGLGFAMPAAVGLRMAVPTAPVIAIVGDGSSMYSIQALWSARERAAGVLFVCLANGGYAVMDRLAERQGATPAWPGLDGISVATIARGFGVASRRFDCYPELRSAVEQTVPRLGSASAPLLWEVAVAPDREFAP